MPRTVVNVSCTVNADSDEQAVETVRQVLLNDNGELTSFAINGIEGRIADVAEGTLNADGDFVATEVLTEEQILNRTVVSFGGPEPEHPPVWETLPEPSTDEVQEAVYTEAMQRTPEYAATPRRIEQTPDVWAHAQMVTEPDAEVPFLDPTKPDDDAARRYQPDAQVHKDAYTDYEVAAFAEEADDTDSDVRRDETRNANVDGGHPEWGAGQETR